jgi:prepilin peptidase CpaA
VHSIAWWPNLGVLVLASIIDIWTRRVPNWLVLPFLASGIAVQIALSGWAGVGRSVAGIALALLLFGIPCFLGGMGMGDLKLAAGIGAWIGPAQLLFAFIMTSLAGGLLALLYAAARGILGETLTRTGNLLGGERPPGHKEGPSIPYVPAIAIGTLFSFFAH